MKRKFLMIFCAAALTAGLLAGCGSDDTKENTDTTEKTETTDSKEDTDQKGQSGVEDAEDAGDVADEKEAEAAGFTDGAEEEGAGEADKDTAEGEDSADADSPAILLDTSKPLSGKHHAEIVIKDYGTIELELDADTAPITVTNFVKLAQENFYDGLTFHRIMDGFMMQGGDPKGDGTGGAEENIKGEFTNNGVENNISHAKGVISMARAADYDSASSQFFIMQADSTYLDGDYAAFGHVTKGLDIVDKICKDAKPTDQNGSIAAEEQPVMEKVKIID